MSTYYLDKSQPEKIPEKEETSKSSCYDIESEVKLINEIRSTSFSAKDNNNATQSTASTKNRTHFSHKVNRITMLTLK